MVQYITNLNGQKLQLRAADDESNEEAKEIEGKNGKRRYSAAYTYTPKMKRTSAKKLSL